MQYIHTTVNYSLLQYCNHSCFAVCLFQKIQYVSCRIILLNLLNLISFFFVMTIFMFVICTLYSLCKRRGKTYIMILTAGSVYYVRNLTCSQFPITIASRHHFVHCFLSSYLCNDISTKLDLKSLIHARKVFSCILVPTSTF